MKRLSDYLKEMYGEKIYRLSLTSGCTCPNRDGKLGFGGCTFCSEGGSGEFAAAPGDIDAQIEEAKGRIAGKTDARRFIAYFQSYTNTYGDPGKLEELYRKVILREDMAVLAVGTRPDCLPEEILDMLSALSRIKPVWVELGLQTMHDRTAERIHRGYPLSVFDEKYRELKKRGLAVIVHVIMNLPGETEEDMLDTIRYLASLRPELDGIKIQMLQVLRGTELGREYERRSFPLMTPDEYAELVAKCVQILPENTVLHRMTGDGPRRLLIAPIWSLDKKRVLNMINQKFDAV